MWIVGQGKAHNYDIVEGPVVDDTLTGGKGVTFVTGTPISNSMTELYTNMRYSVWYASEAGTGAF